MGKSLIHPHSAHLKEFRISAVRELLDETQDVEGGVTRIASGDVAVRILGRGAEPLLKISEKIQEMN